MNIPKSCIEPFGVLNWPMPMENPCVSVVEDFQIFEVSIIAGGHRPTAIPDGTLRTNDETFGVEVFIDGEWMDAQTVIDDANS